MSERDVRGDDDDGMALSPGLRPWWRSVGFWLGAWVLVFLLWVWGDTSRHGSQVGMGYRVSHGSMGVPFASWLVRLEYGSVVYQETRVLNDPRDVVIKVDRVTGYWRKAALENRSRSVWGSSTERIDVAVPLVFELRKWWCSFGFLVAGYVVVWVGMLVMWRRWMRRRAKAAEVVEG